MRRAGSSAGAEGGTSVGRARRRLSSVPIPGPIGGHGVPRRRARTASIRPRRRVARASCCWWTTSRCCCARSAASSGRWATARCWPESPRPWSRCSTSRGSPWCCSTSCSGRASGARPARPPQARAARGRGRSMMTGHASIESAVGCIRRGAFDYLAKPFDDVHRVRTTVQQGPRAAPPGAAQPRARGGAARARRRPSWSGTRRRCAPCSAPSQSLRHNESHVLDPGRERHGQGAGRARDPREQPAGGRRLRAGQLRRAARDAARERAASGTRRAPSPGALGAPRAVRDGRRRHALPRRDRRDARRACRPSCCACSRTRRCARSAAPRPSRSTSASIAATNRDLAAMVERRALPRGSLLPPQRGADRGAAAARAARGHPAARAPLPGKHAGAHAGGGHRDRRPALLIAPTGRATCASSRT